VACGGSCTPFAPICCPRSAQVRPFQAGRLVCLGAEKNFINFAERMEENGAPVGDQNYFKLIVGKAILWHRAEDLFDELELEGYRANSVAYAVAWMAVKSGGCIDLMAITGWRRRRPVTGRPDFVFQGRKVAVFVDGCFWHGCPKHATKPRNNAAFWRRKLAANKARDQLVTRTLRRAGWRVLRVWEHDLPRRGEASIRRIQAALEAGSSAAGAAASRLQARP
jgi:DNA mismatch endonuclease, patch repair protein